MRRNRLPLHTGQATRHDAHREAAVNAIELDRRHWAWLNLPPAIEWLTVRSEAGFMYVQLARPSRELATQALVEAVMRHAADCEGASQPPRLIIDVR